MLCWYVICLFILCGIILCFRQGSKVEVEQFHWLVIPCINIFEIKKNQKKSKLRVTGLCAGNSFDDVIM